MARPATTYSTARAGDDTIRGFSGNDTIIGNGGNDTIDAGDGNDTITTGTGNDNIYTGAGVDSVSSGAGNDSIYSQSSGGTIDGGDGWDYYGGDFAATAAALTITISDTTQISNGIVISNVESVAIGGGSGDDLFTVSRVQSSGQLYGAGGHDALVFNAPLSAAQQFSVVAYSGDQLDGTIGTIAVGQTFSGFETVSFTGGQYNDQFQIRADYFANSSGFSFDGAGGADILVGDFSLFAGATSLIVASNGTITSNRGQFVSIESFTLTGGSAADTLVTGSANDNLSGGAGADHLDGGAGNDFLYSQQYVSDDDGAADLLIGGAGNDTIAAGYGDTVDGGAGTDKLYYTASSATAGITADFSQLTSGGTITIGGATLTGIEQVAQIIATNYNDTIIGGSGADTIYGGDGNDTLAGGAGFDTLSGGSGSNTFADTAAGLNGDTLNDFKVGDAIIITNANLAGFTFSYSGNVLTYTGGTLYILSQLPGHLVASAAPGGGVELSVQLPPLATVDQIASQLTSGYWDGDLHRWNVAQGGTLFVNISSLTATEQTLAHAALAEWADIIGVHFQEVTTGGQIVFTDAEDPGGPVAQTFANWSNGTMTSATVQISKSWINVNGTGLDSQSFETYVHEIGHALGLGHAGNYNFVATYPDDALFLNDSVPVSVMSYFDQSQNYYFANQHFSVLNVVTPMQADIVAMQSLYGLSTTTRLGDTVYGFNSNAGGVYNVSLYPAVAYTIFDSGGNDTIDYSGTGASELINLNPETFSNVNGYTGNLSIGRGVVIENAIAGNGSDALIGNSAANTLSGLGGNDILNGGASADTLVGGTGNDSYVVDQAGDVIIELAGEGDDTVIAKASYTLGAGVSVETMTTINGSATTAINLTGNEFGQSLYGNAGNNILTGMGGSDYLVGGAGNDKYYVDQSDFIAELVGGDDDMVVVPTSYILRDGAEIETLVAWNQDSLDPVNLTGNEYGQSLYGSQGANSLNGGAGNDYLVGLGGNDFLLGGAGNDNMAGGQGNDIYYVDSAGDQIFETANEGDDIAVCFSNFALGAGQSVETLAAAEGVSAINLTGNALGQSLYGNAGANVLSGNGGADYLSGGAGNDVFVLANPNGGGIAAIADYAAGDVVDVTQVLSVGAGTNVISGGYLKITAGGQIQVDQNGGGDQWVTLSTINGSGSVTIRYLSGGNATDLSVAHSANAVQLDPTAAAKLQPSALMDHDAAALDPALTAGHLDAHTHHDTPWLI